MKILSGAYLADEGEIYVDGRKHTSRTSRRLPSGIGMIYQDLALFNNLDVAGTSLSPGVLPRPLGLLLDKKHMYQKAEALIKDLRVDIQSPG